MAKHILHNGAQKPVELEEVRSSLNENYTGVELFAWKFV